MDHQKLKDNISADMPRLRNLLDDLIRFPSVSAPGYDRNEVRRAADYIVDHLEGAGFENVQLLEPSDGSPAVFGEIPGPEGAPTLLLYAHYDVQPPGPAAEWETGPFEPHEKDGRLYGRGASDDKAGLVMHLGAVAAHGGQPPVGVQVFFEGEEESGSPSLEEILETHKHLLKPDIIVIGDGGNWSVGTPAFLTSLRGLAAVSLELRTLESALHSGQFGGVFPDALTALVKLLASLHDDEGRVAIPGLVRREPASLDYPEELAREQARPVDGLHQIGSGSITSRLWEQPSIATLAIDAPAVSEAINQLVPVARAKVSLRLAPGEDSKEALNTLKEHLVAHTPWGAELTFIHEEHGEAIAIDTDNYAVEAWSQAFREGFGKDPVNMGAGGSIPFIATFEEMFPDAPTLVIGCCDPTSAFHAPNESQDLADLEKCVVSEAIAFSLLAEQVGS